MTPARLLASWSRIVSTRQFLVASVAIPIVWFFASAGQSWRANPETVVIDIPLYGQVVQSDLVAQAETLAEAEISRQFSRNGGVSEIQVVVLGDRNGETVPILTATVSRTQWQENPQVDAWTQYYSNSYALLRRHEDGSSNEADVAVAARRSAGNRLPPSVIDRAYDEGRLSGEAVQREYLADLD